MAKVTDILTQTDRPVFIADFTPPRGADSSLLDGAARLADADFVSVAYNPGKLVRVDSVAAAYQIRALHGVDVVFNLSPRDMNKIALESRLLGAAALGLENVVVLQGDAIGERDAVTPISDYYATGLIEAVKNLNDGLDYRGTKLRSTTDFCIGATIDPTRDTTAEVALVHRKVSAGAHLFITQPVFSPGQTEALYAAYRAQTGEDLSLPVFWGVQVLAAEGVLFSGIPDTVRAQVEAGRDGVEIALEAYEALRNAGERAFYVVAPIMRGGARDYESAARFLAAARGAM